MSTVIIITPPPTKPPGSGALTFDDPAGAPAPQPYDEARELIDQAEAAGDRVRIVKDE